LKIIRNMIKSKYLRITAIIALVFIFGSCSDEFLELENPNRVTDENLKSPSGIRQLEIGMYTRLADNYNYFWQLYMSHLPGEYEMKETTGEGPYHQEVWNLNIKPTNTFIGWLYSAFYASLNNANRIISYMEEGTGTVNELPEREFDLILGSAYYIRALNHFFLLHSWGRPFDGDDQWGIVLQTSIVSEQTDYQKGRSAPSVVYAQIEQDLINAKSRLPLTTG